MDNQTVILRVQLDESKAEEKLAKLVLDMEATRKAQQELTAQRKAGTIADEAFAQQSVKLANQLTLQRAEQRNLTKDLDLYRTAQNGQVDSYKATQAALSLAIRQQQELAGSADNSSEASQALTRQIEQYRATLKSTDEQQGSFFRNIGNYPKGESLAPLVQQLVKLEEVTKSSALTAEDAAKADAAIIGYKQQIAQAGAKEGKSYEETTDFLKQYSAAIRPATQALVQLEQEQREVAESGKATGEQVAQIGFRFGQAQKQIKDATEALKDVPPVAGEAAEETKGLGAGLLDAAKSSNVLGGAVDVLSSAKEKYVVAANLAKAATAGEVTVLGLLRLALIATGLGLFVVVLGSLVAFLTKSQTGIDLVSRKLAALSAVVRVVTNLAIDFGQKLVAAADNPKQAFSDLVDFLETNLLNRFKAIGVIIDAIRNRDFSKLTDGVVQLGTGITDASAKAKAFAQELASAATSAQAIEQETQRIREAERALNVERAESRAKIEALKKASDDSTKSVGARTAAAKEAATIENGLLAEQLKLQDDKITNLKAAQSLQKNLTTEDRDALAALRSERANTAQESLTLQTELQNKINSLAQEGIDKGITARQQALALELAILNKQLAQVQVNSDKELALLQQKLNNGRAAELNVKNLTIAQKKAIDVKYETDSLALTLDFNRRRMLAALQSQADLTTAELAGQQAGSARALQLQVQQIEEQRRLALAALNANADNTAAIEKINAQAAQQRTAAEYAATEQALEDYLEGKRQIVERDYATGKIGENQYQKSLADIDAAGYEAALVNAQDYGQDKAKIIKAQADLEIREANRVKNEKEKIEEIKKKIQDSAFEAAASVTDQIIENYGRESAAGQVALTLKKTLALAEIGINLEKQLTANAVAGAKISESGAPYTVPLGIAYTIATDALAITGAAAAVANVLKFQDGGIAYGPSHAQGGIPLYHRGRPAGIEIEGGEPVLHRGVSANPLLLSLASTVNQLAGGRALVPNFPQPQMALGGVSQPLILDQLRGQSGQLSPTAIGNAVADSLRKNPAVNVWSDFERAKSRNAFKDATANS